MKKIHIALISIILFVLSIGFGRMISGQKGTVKSVHTSIASAIPSPLPSPTTQQIAAPFRLRIASLGVDAHIEHVGLDAEKRMDVPKEDMNVGWYNLGPKPGEVGSAVVAGHFDTRQGTPAIFHKLDQLQPGDAIEVETYEGKILIFEVVETKRVKDADFPLSEVFARRDGVRLNLITCAGTYNTSERNYDERFIVYSVLKQ